MKIKSYKFIIGISLVILIGVSLFFVFLKDNNKVISVSGQVFIPNTHFYLNLSSGWKKIKSEKMFALLKGNTNEPEIKIIPINKIADKEYLKMKYNNDYIQKKASGVLLNIINNENNANIEQPTCNISINNNKTLVSCKVIRDRNILKSAIVKIEAGGEIKLLVLIFEYKQQYESEVNNILDSVKLINL